MYKDVSHQIIMIQQLLYAISVFAKWLWTFLTAAKNYKILKYLVAVTTILDLVPSTVEKKNYKIQEYKVVHW